jgi:energy-converting hydrogenase Eha subunit A
MITDGLNPITVLLFVGAALAGAFLVILYVILRLIRRDQPARITLRVLLGGVGLYLLLFLGASVLSRNRVLAPGEEKHICEIDCHLAYSVVGSKAEPQPDGHVRETVTVKVRFDEETISARRPRDATLTPNSRYVALVDAQGHRYPGSVDGLRRPLVPGESYTTDLVFDVPVTAQGLRLVLRNNDPETTFIIAHENSLLHGKTTFALVKAS